jgi:DnaJ-class molecular chaperone
VEFRDYYATLGVKKGASEKEIRSAYRKLARELHPDLKPGDKSAEKRFKEVNEAYEVLSDPEKRKKYDQLGANWRQYEQWQRAGGNRRGGQPFDWSDLFAGSAPGAGGRTRAGTGGTRGPGPTYERTVTPEELEDLLGGGGAAGAGGSPFSDFFQTFFGGFGGGATTTTTTGGGRVRGATTSARSGRDVDQPVDITLEEAFAGTTRVIQVTDDRGGHTRRLEVKIPAGVAEGARVRVAGQGGPGVLGGPAGDLYLVVHITPSPLFSREGDDVQVKVPVRLTTAVLGGEIEVPTPKGTKLALKVPAGTQDGRRFRLRGQGMPKLGGSDRGDLIAEVHVQLPEQLSDRQRELFEELAKLEGAPA